MQSPMTIESQFKEIVDSGIYTLDAAQLLSMDVQVHAMSKEEMDRLAFKYSIGKPMWRFDAYR